MTDAPNPVIAILAGGQSRRMGCDKAQLIFEEKTLLDRLIDQAQQVSDTVAVVGRHDQHDHVTWLQDRQSGQGPMGGLETALAHFDGPVLLVACDMPLVDADALAWLRDTFQSTDAASRDGLITVREGRVEPLFSVYTPQVLSAVQNMLAEGRRSLTHLIERGDFTQREAPDHIAPRLENINTPADLAALRQRLE